MGRAYVDDSDLPVFRAAGARVLHGQRMGRDADPSARAPGLFRPAEGGAASDGGRYFLHRAQMRPRDGIRDPFGADLERSEGQLSYFYKAPRVFGMGLYCSVRNHGRNPPDVRPRPELRAPRRLNRRRGSPCRSSHLHIPSFPQIRIFINAPRGPGTCGAFLSAGSIA